MDKKIKTLEEIKKLMVSANISPEELSSFLSKTSDGVVEKFDLAIVVDGETKRVPFDEGKNANPIGIYPLDFNIYLCLTETDYNHRYQAKEDNLPTLDYLKKLYPIRHKINSCLKSLKADILEDEYFARSEKSNCIVGFYDNQKSYELPYDVYGQDAIAKIRYVGMMD